MAIRLPDEGRQWYPIDVSSFELFRKAIVGLEYNPSDAYDFCWMDCLNGIDIVPPPTNDWIVAPSKSEFLDLASVLEVDGLYPHDITDRIRSHPLYSKFC